MRKSQAQWRAEFEIRRQDALFRLALAGIPQCLAATLVKTSPEVRAEAEAAWRGCVADYVARIRAGLD